MKIDRPKISPELSSKNFQDIFYEEDPTLEVCEIIDSTFENECVDRVRLYDAVIKNCKFTNTDFSNIDITDVCFENCDLSNVNLSNSSVHRVEFKNSKL
ncbi:TPA: pentapeptide repeat-containing protein, partial [Bacillus cereus]|nr:pentapeptide repeat-containing protein [Bacillus cereus]